MNNGLKEKLFEKNYHNLIVAIIALVINAVLLILVAVFLQKTMDIAISGSKQDVWRMLKIGVGFVLTMNVFWFIERHYRNKFIENALCQIKTEIFTRISRKSIAAFQTESTSKYLSALTNDINSIENNYLQNIFVIFLHIFYFVLAIVTMLCYDVKFTGCVLLLMVFSFVVSALSGGKLMQEEKNVSQKNENFVNTMKDLLNGFPVIKSFGAEKAAISLFIRSNDDLERNKCSRRKAEFLISIVGNSMGFVVQVGVMLTGAFFVLSGRITAGVLIAFIQLMNYIVQPIQMVPKAMANRKAALELISKIEDATANNNSEGYKIEVMQNNTGIRYIDVNFAYEGEQNILNHINLDIASGKSYAIVGASGSGKSTLVNLLLGGYDNYQGNIYVNGVEVKSIKKDSLYSLLSVVWQNVYIFDDTIENNITMFGNYSKEEIYAAIHLAGLDAFIREKGLSYQCGDNGSLLSGGEKQRISIARCLIKKPSILIMDEATSALDTETSKEVESSIMSIDNVTKIVITHKLYGDVLKKYDEIIVMRDGVIDSKGSYEELVNTSEYFNVLISM